MDMQSQIADCFYIDATTNHIKFKISFNKMFNLFVLVLTHNVTPRII